MVNFSGPMAKVTKVSKLIAKRMAMEHIFSMMVKITTVNGRRIRGVALLSPSLIWVITEGTIRMKKGMAMVSIFGMTEQYTKANGRIIKEMLSSLWIKQLKGRWYNLVTIYLADTGGRMGTVIRARGRAMSDMEKEFIKKKMEDNTNKFGTKTFWSLK
jgi:hypothetical protein